MTFATTTRWALCLTVALATAPAHAAVKAGSKARTRASAKRSKAAKTGPAKPAKAPAQPATQTAPAGAPTPNASPDPGPPTPSADKEVTRYKFTGLDIDGELRTPALLQFLARIGGEFETLGIPHRSFMPELQHTATQDAL